MKLILTLCALVYIWNVGFHDGHNPKPDPNPLLCPSGKPALIDWHGYWCEEMNDEPRIEPEQPKQQNVQRQWRDA